MSTTTVSVPDPRAPQPAAPASAATASPHQTLEGLAKKAGRGFTVIRNSFVQEPRGNKWVGSSLGRLVKARQGRAVLAYLLLLMMSSALDRRPQPLEAGVWVRALSPDPPAAQWSEAAMTPIWAVLAEPPRPLVTKERAGRLVKVTPRKENGKAAYLRPRPDEQTNNRGERYFILPDAFWLEGWHQKLRLPGVAVLLILLAGTTSRDEAYLSPQRAEDWYGISPKTMYNGLEELRRHTLITAREEWVPEPLSAIGRTKRTYYSLTGVFSRQERQQLQVTARAAAKKRAETTQKRKVVKRKVKAKVATPTTGQA